MSWAFCRVWQNEAVREQTSLCLSVAIQFCIFLLPALLCWSRECCLFYFFCSQIREAAPGFTIRQKPNWAPIQLCFAWPLQYSKSLVVRWTPLRTSVISDGGLGGLFSTTMAKRAWLHSLARPKQERTHKNWIFQDNWALLTQTQNATWNVKLHLRWSISPQCVLHKITNKTVVSFCGIQGHYVIVRFFVGFCVSRHKCVYCSSIFFKHERFTGVSFIYVSASTYRDH